MYPIPSFSNKSSSKLHLKIFAFVRYILVRICCGIHKLGHPSLKVLHSFLYLIYVFLLVDSFSTCSCVSYLHAKIQKLSFSMSHSFSNTTLQLVHNNAWRPSLVISNKKLRYYISFVHDLVCTCTLLFSMTHKLDVHTILKTIILFVENLLVESNSSPKFVPNNLNPYQELALVTNPNRSQGAHLFLNKLISNP